MLHRLALLAVPIAAIALVVAAPQVRGQGVAAYEDADAVRAAIERAQQASQRAAERARSLEAAAAEAEQEAAKVARQSAALAARIQETEAQIAVAQGRLSLIARQQRAPALSDRY